MDTCVCCIRDIDPDTLCDKHASLIAAHKQSAAMEERRSLLALMRTIKGGGPIAFQIERRIAEENLIGQRLTSVPEKQLSILGA